ncbi:hypothetical protein HID58_056001 [Brassica napus]|uniref:Uncharacterized protein n=1 Tax=Brassica napus TaxID=3708 RepID=A0ABQ8AMV0_BRANA|nr:hypothetical protein HID58_056001 [Brassica napus]
MIIRSCLQIPNCAELHLVGLGQSSVVFDVVFLSLTCHLVFGDLTSMLFFISRGWLHGLMILFRLLFYLCSLILLHLSLLLASLVWIVFSSVYALCAWNVISNLKFELLFFGGRLPFFLPQSFVVLRWHERLVCACLVCECIP